MQELWDLYDENRNSLGKTHVRGVPLNKGEYHIVVEIWTITPGGRILIDKRHPDKPGGCLWECTGGSVTAGENSLIGALRELEEEVGIKADSEELRLISSVRQETCFIDTYVMIKDINLDSLELQNEEVTEAKLVTFSVLDDLFSKSMMVEQYERYLAYREIIEQYAKP